MAIGKKVGRPASKFEALQACAPKCPECGSVIYSRRNVLCGACGQRLPKRLLFTDEEREMVEKELKDAKKRSPTPPADGDSGSGSFFISSTDMGNV